MKKLNYFLLAVLTAFVFVSCEKEENDTVMVNFEDVTLTDGIYNGSDLTGTPQKETSWGTEITNYYKNIQTGPVKLLNIYTAEYKAWKGFAVSSKKDVTTNGYENQYSAITGSGAGGSAQYGVVFENGKIIFPDLAYNNLKSLMITNSTWAYKAITEGSGLARKFGAGDYFKVIFEGFKGNAVVATQEFYLADFRDGKSVVVKDWTKFILDGFDNIDYLKISFDSSDKNEYGILTPTYVCIDNVEYQTVSVVCDCAK